MDAMAASLLCTATTNQKGHDVMAKSTGKANADLLRSIPLFAGVADKNFPNLVAAATLRQFAPRTVLFNEGGSPDNLYVVVQGSVELFSEHDERSFTAEVVRAPRPLALYAILSDHNPLSARTLERSELLALPGQAIVDLLRQDMGFAYAALQELAGECHDVVEGFKSHRLRSTTERVAHWMLHVDRRTGETGRIVIPFDKRVLASYLGMAPEHLSRSFATLAAAGVVVRGRSVTLTDKAALARAAGLSEPD
jgi:CRP/FNR family transcriptional activator FtrB